MKTRKIILKKLSKNTNIQIVANREEADFAINFLSKVVERGSNILLETVSNKALVGEMTVYFYLPIKDGDSFGRIRILWSKRKVQDWSGGLTFDKHPASSATGSFLKAYKKVNK